MTTGSTQYTERLTRNCVYGSVENPYAQLGSHLSKRLDGRRQNVC
jgi:hypothetical protein